VVFIAVYLGCTADRTIRVELYYIAADDADHAL
jgi:hypothetical protein